MADTLAGFPFWKLQFNEKGDPPTGGDSFLAGVPAAKLTDLFVFSHGWNNDPTTAMALYTGFFGEVRKIVDDASVPKRRQAVIGVTGIVWPSILFPDDAGSANTGGAASFDPTAGTAALASELPKVFVKPEQQQPLQDLIRMLADQASDNDTLFRFRDTLARLVSPPTTVSSTQDNMELLGLSANDDQWLRILDSLGMPQGDDGSQGGAADFGGFFGRAWNGAKNALRGATYYEMKNRAGVIGKNALGPLLSKLHAAAPNLKVHLLGHSFGARLVSYALTALASGDTPVKSLFLLQGAFSHFAFADALPFDSSRKGDLAGMAARVDGPLLTTFTSKDLAVGNAYPIASIIAGQDASDASDLMYRWEGMGHDGAQAVNAAGAPLGGVKTAYAFQKGQWLNLDGNQIIIHGGPPSGAHGDIVHPETAWAAIAAAGIA